MLIVDIIVLEEGVSLVFLTQNMTDKNSKNGNHDQDDQQEDQQQGQERMTIVAEEHAIWKKNSPLLYDWVSTYAMEWPSLTLQWLPEVTKSKRDDYYIHRMILGTNTSDQEPNYLMIAEIELPSIDSVIDVRTKPDGTDVLTARFDKVLDIKTRILHDGEVNRARYMPQNSVSCLLMLFRF